MNDPVRSRPESTYAHMCRDGHDQIGHNDSSSEMCPMCRAIAALQKISDEGNDGQIDGYQAADTADVALTDLARGVSQ